MKEAIFAIILIGAEVFAQDSEMSGGHFKSENNLIEEIHVENSPNKDLMVLKFKNRLSGKNSRARVVIDKRSNYGDSVSNYAYVQISKDDLAKTDIIRMTHAYQINVDVIYTCGEQPDDKKRKLFPYFVETNCEVTAITAKKPKEKRSPW